MIKLWVRTAAAVFALAACTATALAQTAAPNAPGTPGPGAGRFQEMRQMRREMGRIAAQTRTQMLNALTPAHRTLLSNVVGQLAVAPTPDVRAAARQLDSALSPSEKQAILNAQTSERTQMQSAMQQMRAQMPPPPGGTQRRPMMYGQERQGGGERRTPSAGIVLLRHAMMVRGPVFVERRRG